MSARADAPPTQAPAFAAPWQARAFAAALALHEHGLFAWTEWTQVFAEELARAEAGGEEDAYFRAWLKALERLASAKGALGAGELEAAMARLAAAQEHDHSHGHDHAHDHPHPHA